MDQQGRHAGSIETPASWVVAGVALAVLSVSYGAPLVTVVALKPIAAEFGTDRAAPALAVSLTYIGSGMGGIVMGWIAGRVGMRPVAIVCGLMITLGLVLASYGGLYQLYASNLLLIGLLGGAGMFSPMLAYVTRWFDRPAARRSRWSPPGSMWRAPVGRCCCRSASMSLAGGKRCASTR